VACHTGFIALASVIVTNYNYGHYLRAAIDSALAQSLRPEVVVVDDGSTDDSRQIIASYGNEVIAVLKDNAGQTSAFNAGLGHASGEMVIFLDADDILLDGAIERVLEALGDDTVAKAHWQLRELGEDGQLGDRLEPAEGVSDGDLRDEVVTHGPGAINSPPTSGNAWRRSFLDAIFPLPSGIERCADAYMGTLAALHGKVVRIDAPLSAYRKHEESYFASRTFDIRLQVQRAFHDRCCEVLERECRERGLPVDRRRWDEDSWICPLEDMVRAVHHHVPAGQRFILVDDNQCDMGETSGRPAVQLIARDGVYWGAPDGDDAAIAALEGHMSEGIEFLALAPESRWWLDEYPHFFRHLAANADVLVNDASFILYRLRAKPDSSRGSRRATTAPASVRVR
jgi:hypothetical protein